MNTFFGVWPPSSAEEMNAESVLSTYRELISRGVTSIRAVRLPDGNLPPYGNTGLTFPEPARAASQSGLMPVYGHLSLGDGQGDQQTQVNLGFEDSANHTESDVMSLMLYAHKSELIGEIRDSRMPGRAFTESTFAHNTVAINRATQPQSVNQEPGNVGHFFTSGSLFEFEPNLNGISLAEVDGSRAYVNVASRYQRLLILNAIDGAHPYVIDFFRLKGGTVHDYFLHGAPRFD